MDKQSYELHEYYRKQISGQSRKITKLLKENKKLRIMWKQLTAQPWNLIKHIVTQGSLTMVHEQWFWSDPHFFHANILKFTKEDGSRLRPFNSLDEMHETKFVITTTVLLEPKRLCLLARDITFQYNRPFQELMWGVKGK